MRTSGAQRIPLMREEPRIVRQRLMVGGDGGKVQVGADIEEEIGECRVGLGFGDEGEAFLAVPSHDVR